MLVLGRKAGESITLIDQGVEVVVVSIAGDKCRIGIVAPDEVCIIRTEILERYQADGNESTAPGD